MANWDAARWRAISNAVDEILDLPPDQREEALAALRARNAPLAEDVARLLAEQPAVRARHFLEGGVAAVLPTAAATSEAGPVTNGRPLELQPHTTFGGHRLGRVLGRGGMGVVYEAEEIESGRRVALKVLQRHHDDEYDRERFEREGRLAASIDHEHCVYVFAAEEIAGVPAIAMELMQGTLADRLSTDGPLAPTAAVDAALQLVAGLQAAHAAGILHRDVKPSNCFVDANGVVKIGDFGISRSTRPTEETMRSTRGRFAATPSYASPEQLSGKALDVRADIYSLGATLYELLTRERPFTRDDLMSLLMAVANEPPRPPHLVVAAVPRGLSQIVLKCLAKRPEDRFQTYEALAAALESYASWSPTPATLGRRLLAGAIDSVVPIILFLPLWLVLGTTQFYGFDQRVLFTALAASTLLDIAYYWLCESRWGATLGKALLALTVIDANGTRPRPGAVFIRVLVFMAPGVLLSVIETLPGIVQVMASPGYGSALGGVHALAVLTALFSTARRRNGYASVHDLVSGTRVVTRAARTAARTARSRPETSIPRPVTLGPERAGGFVVVPGAIEGRHGWHPGYDARLGRAVWIRTLAAGTPAIEASRAALSRPTRLRWLAGRRTDREAWDVYEAVEGQPLNRVLEGAVDWSSARHWLADLAHELAAQGPKVPPLDADRVWILDTGRAKLLDDPTEDASRTAEPDARLFLSDILRSVRSRASGPWPGSAERVLRDVPTAPLSETSAQLEAHLKSRATVARPWRLAALVTPAMPALLVAGLVGSAAVFRETTQRNTPPELRFPIAAIQKLKYDGHWTRAGRPGAEKRRLTAQDRAAMEVFLAFRHGAALSDERLFDPARNFGVNGEDRIIVARVRRRIPVDAREGEAAAANQRVRDLVRAASADGRALPVEIALVGFFLLLTVTALVALLLAVACRGLVSRLFGFEIVTASGAPASRPRLFLRALIAWSPIFAAIGVALAATFLKSFTVIEVILVGGLVVLAVGAVHALVTPARGIQDRLAGTWLVPR